MRMVGMKLPFAAAAMTLHLSSAQPWFAGNVMTLDNCGNEDTDEQVFQPTAMDAYGTIIHTASNLCVEMYVGSDTGRSAQLKLAVCTTALQQQWYIDTAANSIRNNLTISSCMGFNVWQSSWTVGDEVGPYACSGTGPPANNELFVFNVDTGVIEAYTAPGTTSGLCMAVTLPIVALTMDNTAPNAIGAVFDGIGVGASEGSSRLLFDYPDNIRQMILANLFSPGQGSGVHILKVEIGGDGQSTMGSEPSHMHALGDAPVAGRGTQMWLAAQARTMNPAIKLYACPWSWPGWLRANAGDSTPYGDPQAASAYIISWLISAEQAYGMNFDYLGVWSDVWDPLLSPAYIKVLRANLNNGGFLNVKLVCADVGNWDCATAVNGDPDLAAAVSILGNEGVPSTQDANATGKTLWSSWLHLNDKAANWENVPDIMAAMQNAYILGNQTAIIPFAAFSGSYTTLPEWGSGAIRVDTPWSATFYNGPLWYALAHTAQFAQPGWLHLNVGAGSGTLANGGTYVTRVSAAAGAGLQWSIVVAKAGNQGALGEYITFTLGGDMATGVNNVFQWSSQFGFSGSNVSFFAQATVPVNANTFSAWIDQNTVTTFTNIQTLGNKPANQPPTLPAPFPLFWADDFTARAPPQPGAYWSDINGAFEIVDDAAAGRGLQQMAQVLPITRRSTDRVPHTVLGDPSWRDIDFQARVFLTASTDAAGLCVRCSAFNDTSGTDESTGIDNMPGAWFFFNTSSWWVQWNLRPETVPSISGNLPTAGLPTGTWLNVRLVARGDSFIAVLNGALLFNRAVPWVSMLESAPTHGFVGLASGDYGQHPIFGAFTVDVSSDACTVTPLEGAQPHQEACQDGTQGQAFTLTPAAGQPLNGPGQFSLMANATLCMQMNNTADAEFRDRKTRVITLQVCNASEPKQFFTVETPSIDGPYPIGPVVGMDAIVVNVYGNNERLDEDISGYEWQGSENEWWYWDAPSGLLYETNMGTCLSFCQTI